MKASQAADVLELLAVQHHEIETILATLGGSADRRALDEVVRLVRAHVKVEREVLLPAVTQRGTAARIKQAKQSLRALDKATTALARLDPDADDFARAVAAFAEEFAWHAHEDQEADLFVLLRHAVDEDDLAEICDECLLVLETELGNSAPPSAAAAPDLRASA